MKTKKVILALYICLFLLAAAPATMVLAAQPQEDSWSLLQHVGSEVSATGIVIQWSANGNPAGTCYEVEQSTDGGRTFRSAALVLDGMATGSEWLFKVELKAASASVTHYRIWQIKNNGTARLMVERPLSK